MSEPARIGETLGRVEATIRAAGFMPGDDNPVPLPWEGSLTDVRTMRWSTVCPERFIGATVADIDDVLRPAIDGWCDTAATNLILLGTVGVGKTHAALAAARDRWIIHHDDVTFWPVVELLDELRPGGSPDVLRDICDVDLLVLDDLGAEKPTDWTAERLFAVVNRRWMECRPIVGTSNLGPEALRETIGERTYSRLVGNDAVVLGVGGTDRRRK